jgi:cyclopropane fatty-acyl-phospholipid synthase-like methyltransferase
VEADPVIEAAGAASAWPPGRLAVTNRLWGEGFTWPGGEVETMRLAHPLGLSSAASLLLVEAGGGGAAGCIARNLGAWVTGLEVEPELVAQAHRVIKAAALGKRATVESWDPLNPDMPVHQYHHCLAIEPLRCGGESAKILNSVAQSLKVGGQLVMTELCADTPLSADDPKVARWSQLEHRALSTLHPAKAITRMLSRVGFDVRVSEDFSARHIENALIGWRVAVRELHRRKPSPAMTARFVAEAEIWLLRVKLFHESRLRMMRWHAISNARAMPRN